MEATAGVADFRIIDPPAVSPRPVAPNRPLLAGVAFIAALSAGIFASFVMSQMREVLFDARSLSESTQMPVLGVVTQLVSREALTRKRRAMWAFAAGLASWFAAWGGLIAMLLASTRSA
jgi:hypothetical protein